MAAPPRKNPKEKKVQPCQLTTSAPSAISLVNALLSLHHFKTTIHSRLALSSTRILTSIATQSICSAQAILSKRSRMLPLFLSKPLEP